MQDQEMVTIFLEEYDELLKIANKSINSFPEDDGEEDQRNYDKNVNDLHRVFHTVKGNSAYLDFRRLKKLSAAYSDFFRTLKERDGKYKVTPAQLELVKKGLDAMKGFSKAIRSGKKGGKIPIAKLIKSIDKEREKIAF